MCSNILCEKQKRGRTINTNGELFKLVKKYYDEIYSVKVNNISKMNLHNLSYVIGQSYKQIIINVHNIIKLNFFSNIFKYIKFSFKKILDNKLKNIDENNKDEIKILTMEHYDNLRNINNIVLTNNDTIINKLGNISNKEWILKNIRKIIPKSYTEDTFNIDLKQNTIYYLKCMYKMYV
jgi:predicted RNA binding protein with dsRBD fold (UPF0201 family)